jgi:AraC-like DNA-binding protein
VIERSPAPALRAVVRHYHGFRETTGAPVRRREGPGIDVIVLLSFGCGWRIGDATDPDRAPARATSFVAGLHETAVLTQNDGRSYGMQISLTPPGAYALLGVPMRELAGRIVALDDLSGRDAARLPERLAEIGGWEERFQLLDATLASWADRARRPSPGVVWAWTQLRRTHGRVRIGALADELGWSRKRLAARFGEEVGLHPKAAARLIRFERAKELLEGDGTPGLAALALECGYYDQAHLTNEVRRITGTTPAAFGAPSGTDANLQDGVARPS